MSVSGATLARSSRRIPTVLLVSLLWILATTSAGALGWLLMVVVGYFTMGIGMFSVWLVVGGLVGLAQGAVLAWSLSASGRFALWRWKQSMCGWLSRGNTEHLATKDRSVVCIIIDWATVSAVGFLLCILVVFGLVALWPSEIALIPESWRLFLVYAWGGIAFGLMQCLLVQFGVWRGFWWVALSAVGWGLGGLIGTLLGDQFAVAMVPDSGYDGIILGPRNYAFSLAQGWIGATVYSVVTALPVALLLRRPMVS